MFEEMTSTMEKPTMAMHTTLISCPPLVPVLLLIMQIPLMANCHVVATIKEEE
jgi:hypothetical protein